METTFFNVCMTEEEFERSCVLAELEFEIFCGLSENLKVKDMSELRKVRDEISP